MRIILSLILVAHGVAHLPGFVVPWRLASPPAMPYRTTVLGGSLELGAAGIRVVGLLWLAAGLGFVAAAIAIFRGSPAWPTLTLAVALFSLLLSVVGWPDSRIGVVVNLALLAYLIVGGRAGWLPGVPA